MYTVKMDKRGKILIPHYVRKELGLFPGQKMSLLYNERRDYCNEDKIIIKPFEYKCRECGIELADGMEYGCCDECRKKNTHVVY